jgi:hypothetical protein
VVVRFGYSERAAFVAEASRKNKTRIGPHSMFRLSRQPKHNSFACHEAINSYPIFSKPLMSLTRL